MERRALLAAVLCLLVLIGYQEAVHYFYPAPSPGVEVPGVPSPVPLPPASAPRPGAETSRPAAEAAPVEPGRVVTVDTDLYQARVATTGGRLLSFRLKRFRTSIDAASEPLEMIAVAPGAAPPLGVRFLGEDGKPEDDTHVAYSADREQVSLTGSETATLTLTGTLPSGARVEKSLTFTGDAYPITVGVRAPDLPVTVSRVGLGWRHHLAQASKRDPETPYRGAVLLVGKKVVHELASTLADQPVRSFESPIGWAGYADHYFLAALAPADPGQARAVVSPENAGVQILLSAPRVSETDGSARFTLYVGPKDVELLQAAGYQLARAVDFGWFSFLALPLLRLLKLFHSVTRNYGIDIILLTILVKVLFIPLTNKSMRSMQEMQRLQPQVAKLREKFKDDRERLNKEMIELYRRHRLNPLGGCLPMLLQFPVFIGLYQALNQAIELRHASFALWVRDLSAHECYPWPGQEMAAGCNDLSLIGVPIPLLVLLMGGSMILQQWLSPSTGMDPTQQRMMMVLMPVMFTVMFVNFPSGLVLYWLVNNVLTIAQQWHMSRARA